MHQYNVIDRSPEQGYRPPSLIEMRPNSVILEVSTIISRLRRYKKCEVLGLETYVARFGRTENRGRHTVIANTNLSAYVISNGLMNIYSVIEQAPSDIANPVGRSLGRLRFGDSRT
jgi:hypothetical protein